MGVSARPALLHEPPPLPHAGLSGLEEGAVHLALHERQELTERPPTVPHESDLDRVAEANSHPVEVDLDGAGLAGPGVELDVGERRAGHAKGVALLQSVLRRFGPQEPDSSRRVGAVVRYRGFAEERLDDRRRQRLGELLELVGGRQSSLADEDGHLIRQVRDAGHTAQQLPAIALTAFAHKSHAHRALSRGFQVHVSKPVDSGELIAVVARLAGRSA
jgi:hypothetical protein